MALRPVVYDCCGTTLTGYCAMPSTNHPVPGVLVAHDASGINDQTKSRALDLARLGYAVFVLDLYGIQGFPRNEMMGRHQELIDTPNLMLDRSRAALRTFTRQPMVDANRLAAVGYCQGGITVLELARANEPILAAIGFHPGYTRPKGSLNNQIFAKVLMMSGTSDPYASQEDFDTYSREMTAKARDWQLHLFGGVGHSYTDPSVDQLQLPGMAYNATADRISWAIMCTALNLCFQQS